MIALIRALDLPPFRSSAGGVMTRRTLAVLSLFACLRTAGAQAFPTKPVRILVPFAAGGGVDLAALVLA